MDKLEKLLSQVRVYVNEDKQRRAEAFRRGECYNVFNVLGVDNMELSHSAFLAALLNPDGSHGMQDAFLKAFIDTIAHGGTKPELDTAHAKVYTEYNIGNITETTGGRIDILITDHSETGSGKDSGHAIIIENKIWAADQPNQLVRYHNFAPKSALLYLTLNGDEPSDQSRGTLNAQDGGYHCISYRSDIIDWLHKCAQLSFDKPRVRETINQYINLLQQLTNQNTMEQNKEQLQLLTENFEQATAVEQSMPDVRKHIFQDIFRKQVEEQLKKEDAPKVTIADCTSDGYSSYTISFRIEGWMQENLLNFTTDRGRMYYGIPRTMEIKDICDKEIADGFCSTPWWIVWKWMPKDYQNWSKDSEIFMHILSADQDAKDANADTETLASIMVKCIQETLQFIAKNNIELK